MLLNLFIIIFHMNQSMYFLLEIRRHTFMFCQFELIYFKLNATYLTYGDTGPKSSFNLK